MSPHKRKDTDTRRRRDLGHFPLAANGNCPRSARPGSHGRSRHTAHRTGAGPGQARPAGRVGPGRAGRAGPTAEPTPYGRGGPPGTAGSADGDGDRVPAGGAVRERRPACARSGSRRSRRWPGPGAVARPAVASQRHDHWPRCRTGHGRGQLGLLPGAVVDPYLDPADAPVLGPGHAGDATGPAVSRSRRRGRVDPGLRS